MVLPNYRLSVAIHGKFHEIGASHLNRRMIEFVTHTLLPKHQRQQQQQRQIQNSSTGPSSSYELTIGIFNDHDFQDCRYTNRTDGRHYRDLNFARIRYLGNVIQHWSNHCSYVT